MFVLLLLTALTVLFNQTGGDGFKMTKSSSFYYKSRHVLLQLTKGNGTSSCKIASNSIGRLQLLQENKPSKVTKLSLTEMGELLHLCPHSDQELQQKHRIRRRWTSIFRGLYPGTNWCGIGNSADGLGRYAFTDACCRSHDVCPGFIAPFSTERGITNYLPYYKYSCDCDLEFYECLKVSKDEIGTSVGQLYFNIFQRYCFKEDTERVCDRKGWWGKCKKRGNLKKYRYDRNPRY